MKIILKHLDGKNQYLFLQNLLTFLPIEPKELAKIIQKIMNEVNKKSKS